MENKERLSPSLSYTLATLLVLIEETDKDHRLSAKAIAEKVKKRLHIDKEESGRIHPHCIQDILAHLGDPEFTLFGKPIDVGPKDNGMGNLGAKRRKGYYLRNRFFSRSEIYTLILALIEAPTLDGDTVCPLVNKLSAYAGPSAPKKVLLDAMVEKVQKRHIPDYWNKIFTLMRACKGKKKVNLGLKGHRPMQASILSLVG